MASQFTIYQSSDASAPALSGTAGSLLALLDAVLVNGYGSKSAAGWSKPIANSGNIGCYKNGSGSSQMKLLVNDNGLQGTLTYREAYAVGWETLSGIGTPLGTGSGQFPTAAQYNTTGFCAWRKSASANSTARDWIIAADAHTFYCWVDQAASGAYEFFSFGDIYSLKAGVTDTYRCMIVGSDTNGSMTFPANSTDMIVIPSTAQYGPLVSVITGMFMPRAWGGLGSSVKMARHSDASMSLASATAQMGFQYGRLAYGPDNMQYMAPLRVFETASGQFRGRIRGLYVPLHDPTIYSNGQTFSGGGDYAGKTFQVIKLGVNGGIWALETSATVETNV